MASTRGLTPRKDPKQARSQATLDAILQAAAQILERAEREAAASSSTQAIADRAGVSIGSIYQYFPTKQALIQALIRHHLRKQMHMIDEMLASVEGLAAEAAAAKLVAALIGAKRDTSRFERSMMRYFCEVGDLSALTQLDHEMVARIRIFLDGLGAQIRPVNTGLAAFIISHALRSAVLLAILQKPEQLDDAEFERELTELVVRYLRPDPLPRRVVRQSPIT
jgi:AcrR family transcriptional regulator